MDPLKCIRESVSACEPADGINPDQMGNSRSSSSSIGMPVLIFADASSKEKASAWFY